MKAKLKKGLGFAIIYVMVKWAILGTIGIVLYKSGHWNNWYLLFVPVIGVSIMALKTLRSRRKLNKLNA